MRASRVFRNGHVLDKHRSLPRPGSAVTLLDAEGLAVQVHAIGDRTVVEALDAFATARAMNGPSTGRHHVAHLQVVAPGDQTDLHAEGMLADLAVLDLSPTTETARGPGFEVCWVGSGHRCPDQE